MTLSILIVNYDGAAVLPACLASVRRWMPEGTEVVVADNGSRDGSPDTVAREFPWVRLVRCGRNLGFAAANNVAARVATGRYLLLLNPDTELVEPIQPALDLLERRPDVAVLTIRALDADGGEQLCVGRFPTPARLARFGSLFDPEATRRSPPAEVDWVQGSFLLTTAENWTALGGMDERHFMYGEDVDYCKRTRDRGRRVVYLRDVRYVHLGGFNRDRFADLVTGMRLYADRHFSGRAWVEARTVLAAGCVLRWARALLAATARPTPENRRQVGVMRRACLEAVARGRSEGIE